VSRPDLQYFGEDGTWVKPPGAARTDIVLQGASGGGLTGSHTFVLLPGRTPTGGGGEDPDPVVRSFPAAGLPDLIPVTVGIGERDGYALFITRLEE
jgi:hypothetical protein